MRKKRHFFTLRTLAARFPRYPLLLSQWRHGINVKWHVASFTMKLLGRVLADARSSLEDFARRDSDSRNLFDRVSFRKETRLILSHFLCANWSLGKSSQRDEIKRAMSITRSHAERVLFYFLYSLCSGRNRSRDATRKLDKFPGQRLAKRARERRVIGEMNSMKRLTPKCSNKPDAGKRAEFVAVRRRVQTKVPWHRVRCVSRKKFTIS